MKKILSIFLLSTISLTGCGQRDKSSSISTKPIGFKPMGFSVYTSFDNIKRTVFTCSLRTPSCRVWLLDNEDNKIFDININYNNTKPGEFTLTNIILSQGELANIVAASLNLTKVEAAALGAIQHNFKQISLSYSCIS